jgi:Tfp pilus assembly protein PilF
LLYAQSLAERNRVLGPDHPATLISWSNLGMAYLTAGRLREATALLEQTLADRERVLGPDQPEP